ncbi:MAG: HEPN domain-containing protein [Firmicutes bacterium]|nr:HEPN domain-containing protein [Bacillota bacterium]
MTNREMAEAHLRQARAILIEARDLHARGVWNLVVRRAQEAVELALKAALRWAGVEVPRVHDVGDALVDHQSRFPAEFRAHLDRFVAVSRRLGRERERSFYGDEATASAPQHLYAERDADLALEDAEFVAHWCGRLIGH